MMACRIVDSFDHYTTALLPLKWLNSGGGGQTIGATGRNGTKGLTINGTDYFYKVFDDQQTWIIGFAYKPATAQDSNIVYFNDGGTNQCALDRLATGALKISRWNHDSNLGTSAAGLLAAGVWAYIECKVKISSTVGTADVWVNGVNVLSLTGVNTQQTGNAFSSGITIYGGATTSVVFDDLYIFDGTGTTCNAAIGDSTVFWQGPTGDGADTGWTKVGADATKWQTLAENPPDTAKVVSTSTVNASYTATFSTALGSGTIKAIQTVISAQRSGIAASTMQPLTRHSGTDTPGVTITPANGVDGFFLQQFDVNPGSGAAWTPTDITTDQFGIKYIGPTNVIAVDQFGLEVLALASGPSLAPGIIIPGGGMRVHEVAGDFGRRVQYVPIGNASNARAVEVVTAATGPDSLAVVPVTSAIAPDALRVVKVDAAGNPI